MTIKKRILLLDAYEAASHKVWREQLIQGLDQYDWTSLVLSPRYFSWRIRGNSLIWGAGDYPELERDYDLIIATSMVDLACLKGLRPNLARVPCLLYFHENQFAYPLSKQVQKQQALEPMMVNLYSALAADKLVFNSQYNLTSFLSGVKSLLAKFPDLVPKGVVDKLAIKSVDVPVPLATSAAVKTRTYLKLGQSLADKRLKIVWNHRWEYDKGPERLLYFVKAMQTSGLDFCIDIIGQQFRRQPEAFEQLKALLKPEQLGHWGFIESRAEYQAILEAGDVVLSTALHDFQGLSILEAALAGCLPLVPRRLAYPQWLDDFCYESAADNGSDQALVQEAQAAVQTLTGFYASEDEFKRLQQQLLQLTHELSFATLAPRYANEIESCFINAE